MILPDGSYLREWAAKLDVPILSIDYTLSLDAPFPRALEEIFYVYCWVLQNPQLVGSTGENIVFVGDSAGGNLMTACMIKCIELGIKKPMGLLAIYSVFLTDYVMAPSRFIGAMDVVLPYTMHMRLFMTYNGKINRKPEKKENRSIPKSPIDSSTTISKNYLLSPFLAPEKVLSQFPSTHILSTNLDP